jgi:8-oxo-dGTP diphosphatase
MANQSPIRAAGVVLLRTDDGKQEFVVVHRPGREDWSLPKGKLDAGEHPLSAAIRECDEETGYSPLLQAPLPLQSYVVAGRPKVVHYWRARVREESGFAPDDEVDEVHWLPVEQAPDSLTYPSEVRLVEIAASLPDTSPLIVVRHTQAMKRSQFNGKVDEERPVSGKGRSQSKALLPLLDAFGIEAVHSSPARRCIQTVNRLAKHLDCELQEEPALSETAHDSDPDATAERAAQLAMTPTPTAVCTHRPVMPTLIPAIGKALGLTRDDQRWQDELDPKLPPGGFIVFHRAFTPEGGVTLIGVERHAPSVGDA